MGHERVGSLPHSQRWLDVIDDIAGAALPDGNVRGLASATLRNVNSRLQDVQGDSGFIASFQFLLGLALSSSPGLDKDSLGELFVDLDGNPSPLKIANALGQYIDANKQSPEYAEIARKAAVDAISAWTEQQSSQLSLIGDDREQALRVWARANSGGGFCEVSRLFFGKFIERYLNYFIGREASSHLVNTESRERLARRLENHVDGVSRHAFETAKITQSFAAGWFTKHAQDRMPTPNDISDFLSYAVSKLRNELLLEENRQ